MHIAIGSDHGGFELKEEIKKLLEEVGIAYRDLGTSSLDSVDYPDFAAEVARRVRSGEVDAGILVCGTGIGMSIAANRFQGIRAAVISDEYTAKMAKAHNNANVICLGGRVQSPAQARTLVKTWLKTEYEGGRHERRLAKLDNLG